MYVFPLTKKYFLFRQFVIYALVSLSPLSVYFVLMFIHSRVCERRHREVFRSLAGNKKETKEVPGRLGNTFFFSFFQKITKQNQFWLILVMAVVFVERKSKGFKKKNLRNKTEPARNGRHNFVWPFPGRWKTRRGCVLLTPDGLRTCVMHSRALEGGRGVYQVLDFLAFRWDERK